MKKSRYTFATSLSSFASERPVARFSCLKILFLPFVFVATCMYPVAARADACAAPPNPIVAENCLPGNPDTEWDIAGAGDPSIQGFATDISVNKGQPISFKVATNASAYRMDIYRIGYYGGK